MPLAISLKQNQDVFIGGHRFVLTKIDSEVSFHLRDAVSGVTHHVTDKHGEEIMADVYVSAGVSHQLTSARVVVSAPRDVLVVRGQR